jgi:hypothetical protein
MTGWVKIYREVWEDDLFDDEPFSKREAWLWIVAHAAWKDTEQRFRGNVVAVKRGQLFTSIRRLAEVWGWSKSSVHRFLTHLEQSGAAGTVSGTNSGTDSGTGRTLITVCNYSKYQAIVEKPGQSVGQSAGQSWDIKEEDNTLSSLRSDKDAGASPDVVLYQSARSVLGDRHIGSVTKLKNKTSVDQAQAVIDAARDKADPVSYFYGALKSARPALTQGEIAGGIYYDRTGRKRCTL